MIFFDGGGDEPDEPPRRLSWRYMATNAGVFVTMVAMTIVGLLLLAALVVFSRVIVAWALVLFHSVTASILF